MTLMGTDDLSFFEVIDPAFGQYVLGNAPVKRIAEGFDDGRLSKPVPDQMKYR
jgi:hypothetical protein